MNEIIEHKNSLPALQISDAELIKVLQTSLYPGAALESIKMVLGYCKASGLDPMQKPVHIVPMWDSKAGSMRDVVMPGIGMYRTQAMRSGACAGISEPEYGPDKSESLGGAQVTYPEWCRVTVKRRLPTGEIVDFTAREFWLENYAVKGGKEKSIAPNAMWSKRPKGQLAKCAQAQALRIAFPELGSAVTADEMEGKPLNSEPINMGNAEVVDQIDVQPYIEGARATLTDETAAAYWKQHNGKFANQPKDHALLKQAVIDHRRAIKAAQEPPIPPATEFMGIDDVSGRMLNAKTLDDLYVATDLIRFVQAADEQKTLEARFEELKTKLEAV